MVAAAGANDYRFVALDRAFEMEVHAAAAVAQSPVRPRRPAASPSVALLRIRRKAHNRTRAAMGRRPCRGTLCKLCPPSSGGCSPLLRRFSWAVRIPLWGWWRTVSSSARRAACPPRVWPTYPIMLFSSPTCAVSARVRYSNRQGRHDGGYARAV